MSLGSRVGDVLGRGSAREGVRHWWQLRATSAALAPLGVWFLLALLTLPDLGYASVTAWAGRTLNAVLLLLFVAVSAWHSALGVQVVVEDYVRGRGTRLLVLLLRGVHVLAAAAAVVAVLKLASGGQA